MTHSVTDPQQHKARQKKPTNAPRRTEKALNETSKNETSAYKKQQKIKYRRRKWKGRGIQEGRALNLPINRINPVMFVHLQPSFQSCSYFYTIVNLGLFVHANVKLWLESSIFLCLFILTILQAHVWKQNKYYFSKYLKKNIKKIFQL